MRKKHLFLVLLSIVLAVVITLVHIKLVMYFFDNPANRELPFDINEINIFPAFMMWLIYFSLLILLPLTHQKIISILKITKTRIPITILILELLLFFFAKTATPPDSISTLLFFLICQPIVLTNWLSLRKKLV